MYRAISKAFHVRVSREFHSLCSRLTLGASLATIGVLRGFAYT